MSEFLPGDRVIYNSTKYKGYFGKTGTVVESLQSETEETLSVHFDHQEKPDIFIATNFERQPIEPGAWVRIRLENDGRTDQVRDIFSTIQGKDYAVLKAGVTINTEHLARIADPVPAPATITGLKQAQELARVLDAKHFDGDLIILDNFPGVLNQIDHMTAHMVRKPKPVFKRGDLVEAKYINSGIYRGRITAISLPSIEVMLSDGEFKEFNINLVKHANH